MKIINVMIRSGVVLAFLLSALPSHAAPTALSVAYSSLVSAATMTAYCQSPPLKQAISPNIMLAVDVSGSMTSKAYTGTYDSTKEYEGYFDPYKYYTFVYSDGTNTSLLYSVGSTTLYYEMTTAPTGTSCVKGACENWKCSNSDTGGCDAKGTHGCQPSKYACCTSWQTTGDCGDPKWGNQLNFDNMRRIDLLRWAMTGGTPADRTDTPLCEAGNATKNTGKSCNPQRGDESPTPPVGTDCSESKGYCLLTWNPSATSDTYKYKVKVPWDRVMNGLVFKLQKLPVVPRMGTVFFSENGILNTGMTYIGDFTAAASTSSYVFDNLIAALNGVAPTGATPTAPAMWDIMNYFAQKAPQYGGFNVSGANKWANPMWACDGQGAGANCIYVPCADNFVLLLSDGAWNKPTTSITTGATGTISMTDADPVVPAYVMHHDFLNTETSVTTRIREVYTVSMFQSSGVVGGELALKNVALYGAYPTTTAWPQGTAGFPQDSCTVTDIVSVNYKGSPCTSLPTSNSSTCKSSWDADCDGQPDTFASGKTARELQESIYNAILEILSRTTAGTAASVLASREGSGANLLQAVYYPKKSFINDTVDWVGNLQNLWYYIDPAFANSTIREDGPSPGDKVLTLKTDASNSDYITQFYYDAGLQSAMASRWTDTNGDASIAGETKLSAIKVDAVANIWEAGELLWARDWKARKVYTYDVVSFGTSTTNLMDFKCTAAGTCPNKSTLRPYLNVATDDQASTIMEWVLGNDVATSPTYTGPFRQRAAKIGTDTKVWKLGDIINSTPKISTWQPLGDYHLTYNTYETTYGPQGSNVYQSDPVNTAYYTTGYRYKGRGMVYTGGNDGMLHAFRLGLLQTKWSGQGTYEKAKLTNSVCSSTTSIFCSSDSQCPGTETCSSSVTLGEEAWAFIPKNVLPYLKYLANPDYCHLYTVDLTPTVFDASIGVPATCSVSNYYDCKKEVSSWRTVLIGGMRFGGGCRKPYPEISFTNCTAPGNRCVNTPAVDPNNNNKGLGYSSYFALDITDQDNPKLLWEYDGTQAGTYSGILGFSYSGPAVVRINNKNTSSGTLSTTEAAQNNGRWLVVFGSGPTGPIDTSKQQFMGLSDRELTLHIFDLATGPGSGNNKVKVIDTNIANSFSGSITTTTFDLDLDYSDDVIYIPYTTASTTVPNSHSGGLLRVVTNGSIDYWNDWEWSNVITNTGPITAAPDMLIDPDTKDLWMFFGTGRYFYDTVNSVDDADPTKRRQIFGMKERCLNNAKDGYKSRSDCNSVAADFSCATPASLATCGGLTNVDNISVADNLEATKASSTDPNYKGWYIDLDPAIPTASPIFYGERMITNPSVDPTGIVFYTTFKPQNNACQKDGQTNIWAVKFDTGGAATGLIKGTAIIQVSTGSIEQVNLATAFTERDNRRTAGMTGQPPTREGLTVIPGAPAVSKPLFMKER